MQKSLSLNGPACEIAFTTVFLELANMAPHGSPPLDLPFVIF
jgi:hypothetical protein